MEFAGSPKEVFTSRAWVISSHSFIINLDWPQSTLNPCKNLSFCNTFFNFFFKFAFKLCLPNRSLGQFDYILIIIKALPLKRHIYCLINPLVSLASSSCFSKKFLAQKKKMSRCFFHFHFDNVVRNLYRSFRLGSQLWLNGFVSWTFPIQRLWFSTQTQVTV